MVDLPEEDGVEPEGDELEAVAPEPLDLDGELSDEDRAELEAALDRFAQQFGEGPGDEEPPDEPEEADEVEEPEPEAVPTAAAPVSQPAPSASGTIDIDGVAVPVEEAVKYLVERERKAAPEPPKPPEWLDQDDPAAVAMWSELQSLKAGQSQVAQNQQRIAAESAKARAVADAEAGISTFRTNHPELTEDDLNTLRLHAVSLDIIDGLTKHRSGPDAILKALDIAYWDHPEFRARATAEPTPAKVKEAKAAERKGKLNALGGSSGSTARTEAKPDLSSDAAAKEAATEWLKAQNIL